MLRLKEGVTMALTVKTGLNAPKDFLDSVFALEKIVYPPDLWGKKENLQSRYEKNNESYILIYDDEKLAGYINFFPISDRIDNDLLNYESQKMWDDDITADDITPWEDANNVFILSVVTAPEYRDGEAIILLGNAFTNFICEKCANGKKIISISGAAVSEGGENFLTRYRAEFFKPLEHGYKYYRTDAVNIAEFIKNKTYKKSYSDDLYFFIPMTSNQIDGTNEKIKQAHDAAIKKFGLYENHFGTIYREAIDSHVDYECNSNTLSLENLKRFYLGEFQFACYNDDYDKKILQTETCHLFISAHSKTGLYIITAAIPNNEYLPTQLIDQMSAGHLDIICPPKEVPLQKEGTVFLDKDKKHSCISIKNYIGNRFDLSICGDPKFVMCLSNMPENPAELAYALAGETYNSEHIDYRILDKHINDLISHNHSSYNYYDSYISSSGIAFILRDFSSNIVKRIEKYEASVLFVVEFVLLQNTAVLRTNRNVIRQLENSDKITNEDIENLYIQYR